MVFRMKSQNSNSVWDRRNFLEKELSLNFERNKFRAFPIIAVSLAL